MREIAALAFHGSQQAERPDSRQSRGRVQCDVVADPFCAGKLSEPGAPLRKLQPYGRKIGRVVNAARRVVRDDTSDAKAESLFCTVILLDRKAERARGNSIRCVSRAYLFEDASIALRAAMQSRVPVLTLAMLSSLPDGAAYRHHGVDIGEALEIVRDDWIPAQLRRLVEVPKQMPGADLDGFRRIRARHDISSLLGGRSASLLVGTSHSSIGVANDYLHRVGPVIREHDGFIDKYIGDAIMGLFPGKADNLHCEKDGKPTIAAGVGIHTGDLMLGTIGERGRMETTVIADAVNAASRLETATKTFACSILLSRETKDALAEPDRFSLRRLGMLQIKGKCEKLEAFECYDGDPADVVEHKQSTAQKFAHALAALEAGGFTEAQEWFSPIAEACASDGPAAFYLQHARA